MMASPDTARSIAASSVVGALSAVPAASEAEDSPDPADDDVHILFAERDDFLADVDAGINENEFKW